MRHLGQNTHFLYFLFIHRNYFFRYQFNKDKITVLFHFPLGGLTSEDLNVPTTLSIPLNGLYGPDIKYQLPSFTIPPSLILSLPLFGLAEADIKISSNMYNWETSFYLGNKTVDVPTYVAEFKTMGHSPVKVLSFKFQGKDADTPRIQSTNIQCVELEKKQWQQTVNEYFLLDVKLMHQSHL